MPRKSKSMSVADRNAAVGGAASVDRALTLLSAFQPGDKALGLGDLSDRTNLYKSTVLRLIASLEHAGLVQRLEDGRYGLGAEIARLNGIYLAQFSLQRLVLPILRELVQRTGESAAYHVRQGNARLCLYRVDSPHPVRDHIKAGDLLPLARGTGGRVLVAFDPELSKSIGRQESSRYSKIRADGYFLSVGDRLADVAGISAPIFSSDGRLAAALTLTMPAHRLREQFLSLVLESSRLLSLRMP